MAHLLLKFLTLFVDETNTSYQIDNEYAFVLPVGGEKIVKVVFEGGSIVNDLGQLPGDYSMEMMVYKKTWYSYYVHKQLGVSFRIPNCDN